MTPKESLREYTPLRTHSINNSPLGRKKLDTSLALEEGNSCFVSNERNIWIQCFLLRNTTLDPHNANCSRTNRRAFKIFTHLFIFQWCLSWNISILPDKNIMLFSPLKYELDLWPVSFWSLPWLWEAQSSTLSKWKSWGLQCQGTMTLKSLSLPSGYCKSRQRKGK